MAGHYLKRAQLHAHSASPVEHPVPEAATRRTFEALYDDHFDFVWRTLRRLGVQPAAVEDAVQDTFVVVHRRLSALREDASPKAFLFGIAMRVAHDYRRSARRKATVGLDTDREPAPGNDPFADAAHAELGRKLERFLATLDEDKRAVFCLFELEGMTAPEISETLGVGLNMVYSRLRTARDRLVVFLRTEEGRHG